MKNEKEAVELANDSPFGLGGSLITKDIERGKRVARQIETGMVFINQPTWTAPGLSFGGVKNSGYGRELSELGIGAFVNLTHGSGPQPSSMRKTHRVDADNDTPLLWSSARVGVSRPIRHVFSNAENDGGCHV